MLKTSRFLWNLAVDIIGHSDCLWLVNIKP